MTTTATIHFQAGRHVCGHRWEATACMSMEEADAHFKAQQQSACFECAHEAAREMEEGLRADDQFHERFDRWEDDDADGWHEHAREIMRDLREDER